MNQADAIEVADVAAPAEKPPGLWEQLREDFEVNGRSWSKPGCYALLMHRLATRWCRWPLPWRLPLMALYRISFWFVRNLYGIELLYTTRVGRRLRIPHHIGIVIHAHATIGDDCLIRHNVTIGTAMGRGDETPVLGNRVSVGTGAVILGRIHIGDDVRIGPNAVVTTDVPAGATVVTPAPRILTLRCPVRQHVPMPEDAE